MSTTGYTVQPQEDDESQKKEAVTEEDPDNDRIANGAIPDGPPADDAEAVPEAKVEEPRPMVGMGEVFRFATGWDRFLIFLGTLASTVHGAAMPLMIIVFGSMTNSFIDNGKMDQLWDKYGPNITVHNNVTREDIAAHPEILQQILCGNRTLENCPEYKELESAMMNVMLEQMTGYTIYYIILGSAVLVISYVQLTCWKLSSYHQCQRIRTSLFQAILRQEIGWFDTHEIGELNTRLSDDVSKIQEGLGDQLSHFFQHLASFIAGFVVGFVYGWELTLVIMAISPLLATSGGVLAKLGSAFTTKELAAYAKAGAVAEETLAGIRTVTAFAGQEKECERYNANLGEAKRFGIKRGIIIGSSIGVVFLLLYSAYSLAFWYGSRLVREGSYTGGDVIVVFFSVLTGTFSIGNAFPNFGSFATARGAAHTVYGIIDQEPSIDSESEEGAQLLEVTGNIEFKDVHFQYPSRVDVKVLQGLNLNVSVGQTVALVGSSGCGKSTTVQLIQRFYDPAEGQVLLDGVDIRQLNVLWLRQQIGVVSQEPVLFGTSIEENIRYGREGVTLSDIERAAKQANAHDFICNLPKQYKTLVGERGAQLSGGQKQRIAIARALIRDPKILLLDEATSALDTESEATVQEALDKAREGRTTLVIAHRLSTIKTADVIVGMDGGVVAEQGTHEELMERGGIYYKLVTNQTKMDEENSLEEEDTTEITAYGAKRYKRALSELSDTAGIFTSIDKGKTGGRDRTLSMLSHSSGIFTSIDKGKTGGRDRTLSMLSQQEDDEYGEVSVWRMMKLNARETPFIILGCLCALVTGAVQPCFALIFSEIMGVFSIIDQEKQKEESEFYSLMFLFIGIGAGTAMFGQVVMFSLSGERLTERCRQLMFRAYMRQDMAYYDDHRNNTGALTTRLASEVSAIQGATGSRLASAFQAVCSICVGLGIGFFYSWKLSLFILAFAPFVLISGYAQTKVTMSSSEKDKTALEKAGKVAVEAIENIRTVAQLTKEAQFLADYTKQTEVPYKKNTRRAHISGIAFGFSQGLVFFAYGFCFRFGAYLIKEDSLEYTNMFKVIAAIIFSAMAVGETSSYAPDYGKAKKAAAKMFALLDRVPAIDSSDITGPLPDIVDGNISFENVKFSYPTRPDVRVLRGLTVEVSRGQTLALVGSSGCGKSTTVSLLERFYDPLAGVVKIDSHNTSEINIRWLRAQLGLVQQEPILFGSSIGENIAYGDNSRDVPMTEIIEAARKANIHEFISSLPQGYDTTVGDKGAQLSGGQKQRVAIARALIRNPTVLLLDEATSALDTESEKVVQEALDKARSGRTCIVIAHRLSTIQDADLIAVIHRGKVAELGKHHELMALQGFYYKLNMAQAKRH